MSSSEKNPAGPAKGKGRKQQPAETPADRPDLVEDLRKVNQQLVLAGLRQQESADLAEARAAQLNALLENMVEGVIVIASDGRVQLMNRPARAMFPLPEREQGWTLDDFRQLDLRQPDGGAVVHGEWVGARVLRGERIIDCEVIAIRPDGSRLHLACTGDAVRERDGRVALGFVVCRDITELRRLQQARDDYVAMISHDLRGPLTVIMGQADWLRRLLESEQRARETAVATSLVKSARRMNAMIQEMVDSVRLETGQTELHKIPTELLHLIRDTVERWVVYDDQRRVQLEALEWVPPVFADPSRLDRVIANLIGNALKYSPPQSTVVVRVTRGDCVALVAVIDRGIGISRENQSQLFDRFRRVQQARQAEGLGLGLYICRLIVEAHGGRIWVESEPGQGSTFFFTVPLVET